MSIVNIQRKLNLKDDGVLGPATAKAIMNHLKLNPIQAAHFLGQCSHETGEWKSFKENLNYSAQGLADTWPTRYAIDSKSKKKVPNELAIRLQRKPEAIANNTYANRNGNGDEESGDGWKFIGRSIIQLTGRENYTEFAKYVNDLTILDNPDKVITHYLLESAVWFFMKNKLFNLCKDISDKNILAITKKINGGTKGLKHRISETNKYYNLLK